MPGKYTDVVKRLQAAEPEDANYQNKVNNTRLTPMNQLIAGFLDLFKPFNGLKTIKLEKSMDEMSHDAVGHSYALHYSIRKQIEALEHYNNLMLAALDQELVTRLNMEKLDQFRFTSLGLFSRKDSVMVKIIDDDAFDGWCYTCKFCGAPQGECVKKPKHDYESRVDYRVRNTNKVAGDVRSMLVEGEEPPPGIEVRSRQSVNFTKEK